LEQEKSALQKTIEPEQGKVHRMMPMSFTDYKKIVSDLRERLSHDAPSARQIIYNQIAERITIYSDAKGVWANLPAKEVMLSKVVGSYWCSGEDSDANLHRILLKPHIQETSHTTLLARQNKQRTILRGGKHDTV
jgi:hypothetical protein